MNNASTKEGFKVVTDQVDIGIAETKAREGEIINNLTQNQ